MCACGPGYTCSMCRDDLRLDDLAALYRDDDSPDEWFPPTVKTQEAWL